MENLRKTLVVFYSKTGTTKRVAEEIAKNMRCDIEEIIDKKKRTGIIGFIIGGRDAMKKIPTEIEEVRYDPEKYDLVIVGSPVWAGNIAPAIRSYLQKFNGKFHSVAFFCTMGKNGDKTTFDNMCEACGKNPERTIAFLAKDVKRGAYTAQMHEFFDKYL